jgi:hypothetical protein
MSPNQDYQARPTPMALLSSFVHTRGSLQFPGGEGAPLHRILTARQIWFCVSGAIVHVSCFSYKLRISA